MEEETVITLEVEEHNQPVCPDCGAEIVVVGHCATCYECGFSLCSL
jgi:hypothetical protein